MHAASEAEQIDRIWKTEGDLVVAGAYGHARLREWVFGGVTRNLTITALLVPSALTWIGGNIHRAGRRSQRCHRLRPDPLGSAGS